MRTFITSQFILNVFSFNNLKLKKATPFGIFILLLVFQNDLHAQCTPGTISGNQTICYNTVPATFNNVTSPAGDASFTYQWQSSPNNSSWSDIAGAVSISYTAPALITNTYYRRTATSGLCVAMYTPSILVTVTPSTFPGSAGANQTICYNTAPSNLSSISVASGGNGTYTYQWQSSPDNVTWTDVAGATVNNYTPGALVINTYFRRVATSGACTVNAPSVLITVNSALSGGVIAGNQSICFGTTPAGLTNTTSPSGGNNVFTYQWQSSTDNITFNNIGGATSPIYSPGALFGTTYYRRNAITGCGTISSNTITITVYASLNAGSVSNSQTICYNTIPATFNGAAASGGNGGYNYQWQSSTDNVTFSNIAGATVGTPFTSVALTTNTYFRRSVYSTTCTAATTAYTGSILVTVTPLTNAGAAGANQTICYNAAPASLTETTPASGGTGTYTYQWQSSPDNISWSNIASANAISYSPGLLTATTYYRRGTISGACTVYASSVQITVYPVLSAGTISGNQTICNNTVPAAFTSTASPAGGNGSFTYQWQTSSDNISFSDIAGATSINYAPAALVATTYFRRNALTGCGMISTSSITVTVYAALSAGSVSTAQTICYNTAPAAFTGAAATGGNGAYNYQWQSSSDNVTFSNIAGATTGTPFTSAALTSNTYFRRNVYSATCGVTPTASTASILVTVNPQVVPGSIAGNQTICAGQIPAGLTSASLPTAGNNVYTYQWQSSPDAVTWSNIAGATSTTYSPSALASTTYYRRGDISCTNTLYTAYITVTVNPVIAGNSVSSAQTICSGQTPLALNAATPTGGNGSYSYQWEVSTTSATLGFSSIPSAITLSYAPGALIQNTWYRITTTSGPCSNTSAAILITINPLIANNTISGTQTVCTGQVPAITLTGTVVSGGNGTYTYQWESSTTSALAGFSSISGATAATYAPAALTQTTWYRRTVNSGTCSNTSTALQITVFPSAPGNPTVFGDNVWNGYSYSDNNFGTYAGYYTEPSLTFVTFPVPFTTNQSPYYAAGYQGCLVPVANFSVSYKRTNFTTGIYQIDVTAQDDNGALLVNGTQVYSAGCCTPVNNIWTGSLTNTSQLEFQWRQFGSPGSLGLKFSTVTPPTLVAGAIGSSQNLCSGDNPVPFTSTSLATGCSQISYQWQSSPDNFTWTDIASANLSAYDAPAVTISTYFRRKVTDACNAVAYSNSVTVSVNSSIPVPSTDFGNNIWNIYCYRNNNWTSYGGYYTEPSLNFSSTTQWNANLSPSSPSNIVTGYQGCQIPTDFFSIWCKRTGFTAGIYQIDLPSHDDDVYLLVNGIQVFNHNGCCDAHTNVWTGPLTATSTVELKWLDGTGGCNGAININPVTPAPLLGGTISADEALCYGNSPAPFNTVTLPSGGCNILSYQWQQSTNGGSTWGDISGAYSISFTDTRSIYVPTLYRRKTTDICGTSAYSNSVSVSFSTSPGDPSVYGSNTWNAYAFQDSTWGIYAGYYVEPTLSFDSRNRFGNTQPPSYASGFQGCQIYNTIYSMMYKRQGVSTPGIYQIDIPAHDDDVYLYIDGVLKFNHNGCCDVHTNVWTGNLTASSLIEFRYKNGNGPGYLQCTFTLVTPGTLVGGTIGTSATLCSGDIATLTNIAPASGSCTPAYQWQSSTDNITFADISGATASSYGFTGPAVTTYLRRKATEPCFGIIAYSNTVVITINNTIPGDPTVFGTNVWNDYAYSDNTFGTYRGYYTENSLSFNTQTLWGSGNSPSDAFVTVPTYSGCQIPDDYFSVRYKRQGFPAGTYQIDAQQDDIGTMLVNGIQVYLNNTCCTFNSNIWTGNLTGTSTIEFKMAEYAGGANALLTFTLVTPGASVTAGTIGGAQTICYNSIPAAFTSSSPGVSTCYVYYQWQSSPDNTVWNDIAAATGLTYTSPALLATTYFRRKAIDACGNINYTTSFAVTVTPSLNPGAVTGSSSTCSNTSPGLLTNSPVASGGNNAYTYQWQSSANNVTWATIGGATSASYTPGLLLANTYYRINVSSCGQTLPTPSFLVTVNPLVSITTQPSSNTACNGFPASFSVAATGTGLTYQWQVKPPAGVFSNIPVGAPYSNPTLATETISDVTGKNNYQYQVIVSGTCGSPVTSSIATLTVNVPPLINTQPVASTICAGANTSFSVVAAGTSISYQWQVNTGSGYTNVVASAVYSNPTLATLTLTNVPASYNTYSYQCIITSSVCGAPVTTTFALLTVNPVIAGNTVSYVGSPVCATTAVGTVTGSTPTGGGSAGSYAYQWITSTTSGSAGFANNGGTGISSNSYSTISQTNWYRRVVSRGGCTDTATAIQIDVIPAVSITAQPVTATVCPGISTTFSVTATNVINYQWQEKIGAGAFTNLSNGGVISGSTLANLVISDVTGKGTNQYRVIVNGCGTSTATSTVVTLNVPTIASNPVSSSICQGSGTSFTITAGGSSGLTYQWQANNGGGFVNLSNSVPYSNVTSATLNINGSVTTAYNGYIYRAIVNGCTASPSAAAILNVYAQITGNSIAATQNICTGAVPNPFAGSLPSGGGGTYSYQWQTSPDNSSWSVIAGATSQGYASGPISATTYFRRIASTASLGCSNTSVPSINVTVNPSTVVVTDPLPASVCQGGTTSFSIVAGGQGLGYQWQVDPGTGYIDLSNGSPYNNVSTSTLTISNAPLGINNYYYRCKVSGNCPSASYFVYSAGAPLTITPNIPVSVSIATSSGTVCSGTTISFTSSAINPGPGPAYQWRVNSINSGTNSSTFSSSGLADNDVVTLILTSNVTCPSGNPATSNAITVSINSPGTWLGGTSTSWNTAANWCGGIVPDITSSAIIKAGAPYNPLIPASGVPIRNLTINSGGILTLASTGTITVKGNIVNNGTFIDNGGTLVFNGTAGVQSISGTMAVNNLTLNSTSGLTLNNPVSVNGIVLLSAGVLTSNGNLNVNVNAGAIDPSGAGTVSGNIVVSRDVTTGWHFLSSPVSGATYADFDDDVSLNTSNFYYYNESSTLPDVQYGWTRIMPASLGTPLAGVKFTGGPALLNGYALKYGGNTNIDFAGTYTHGSSSYASGPLSYTPSGYPNNDGWHLIGNPYPSYINWNSAGVIKSNVNAGILFNISSTKQNTVYMPDMGMGESYLNGGSPFIPPMQAFEIQTNASNATVTINNAARTITPALGPPYNALPFYRIAEDEENKTAKLVVRTEENYDEVIIRFGKAATEKFDNDFDMIKPMNGGFCPSLYTHFANDDYGINSLPPLSADRVLPLHLQAATVGIHSISVVDLQNFEDNSIILLEDRVTGTSQNLKENGVYTFNANPSDDPDRFVLHFSRAIITSSVDATNKANAYITSSDKKINMSFTHTSGTAVSLTLTNLLGQEIESAPEVLIVNGNAQWTPKGEFHGLFIVKVSIDGQQFSARVFFIIIDVVNKNSE